MSLAETNMQDNHHVVIMFIGRILSRGYPKISLIINKEVAFFNGLYYQLFIRFEFNMPVLKTWNNLILKILNWYLIHIYQNIIILGIYSFILISVIQSKPNKTLRHLNVVIIREFKASVKV